MFIESSSASDFPFQDQTHMTTWKALLILSPLLLVSDMRRTDGGKQLIFLPIRKKMKERRKKKQKKNPWLLEYNANNPLLQEKSSAMDFFFA